MGTVVGYNVRFDVVASEQTRLGYMTDGTLLAGAMNDPLFSRYCCVVIDEAHERTIPTDLLLALLKHAVTARDDLKIVIMSATMDARKFQSYFGGEEKAPMIHIPGSTFHVKEFYIRGPNPDEGEDAMQGETPDYLQTSVSLVDHIDSQEGPGDILLFLPSEHAIERACELIKSNHEAMTVLPLYAELSPDRQQQVFAPAFGRKCVVATNIAETTLTIDGIVHVIDCGLVNQMGYNPRACAHILQRAPISQASANQRKGRAGRTGPGNCYRLYTQEMFASLRPNTIPAIARADMKTPILQIQRSGFHDVWSFDWVDQPAPESMLRAINDLKWMGFLDKNAKITEMGKRAAECPVDSVWYYTILQGMKHGCAREIISLAALSSTQSSIFLRPYSHRYAADLIERPNFGHPLSDHITMLNAYHAWHIVNNEHEQVVTAKWSEKHGLSDKTLREVNSIHSELVQSLAQLLGDKHPGAKFNDSEYATNIRKALAAGLFLNSAIRVQGEDNYRTWNKQDALLSPASALVGGQHEWVVFSKFEAFGAKQYLSECTRIEPQWIMDMPYFAEDNIMKNYVGRIRMPEIQESFARARARTAAKNDQNRQSQTLG
ncbi:hypothetical protein KJ359_004701 [Pestalotiopsis sp. 9143b]|nr:hypothetical protein KJ359_004701 [Pestalotiopsis sp. 9143b]